jgi:hypothetical protein
MQLCFDIAGWASSCGSVMSGHLLRRDQQVCATACTHRLHSQLVKHPNQRLTTRWATVVDIMQCQNKEAAFDPHN